MLHTAKKGFTLIELLIVVVIIGILAAIAIPKFSNTKDKAKLASVKTDIRNFMTAEEAYFSDNASYGDFSAIQSASGFTLSPGNIDAGTEAETGGYHVVFKNTTISSGINGCEVYAGTMAADTTAEKINCTEM